MIIGVVKETFPCERRVALVPTVVPLVTKLGAEVLVESGAGLEASFTDAEFEERGAKIAAARADVFRDAGIVCMIRTAAANPAAGAGDLDLYRPGQVLVGLSEPLTDLEPMQRIAGTGARTFALELIPRISRAQSMDVLSSQATVAGYKAVLTGADELAKFLPMFMTAAGTIRPGKVLILGAGVAGLQAIATARRLGAKVEAFDVRPAVKEQIESLGATFLETEEEVAGEGEGGYAKELSEEQHQRELELIAAHIADTDLVITTAQIPGRPAPRLITEEMVDSMHPGSVIVDLAASSGGNCAVTREGETVVRNGVKVMGPANLPAEIPTHASQMFSKNVETLLKELVAEGELTLDFED